MSETQVNFQVDHEKFGTEVIKIYFKDSEGGRLNVQTIPNPNLLKMFDKEFLDFIARGIQTAIATGISQLETADGKRVFKQKINE